MKLKFKNYTLVILIFFSQLLLAEKTNDFKLSKKYQPEKIGDLLTNRFVELNKHELYRGKYINYQEVCLWVAILKYAAIKQDTELIKQLEDRFIPLFTTKSSLIPPPVHVDLTVFGSVPLQLYNITKDERFFDLGISYANAQWELPDSAKLEEIEWYNKGFSWQTRLWIDDMYMITLLQSEAYTATGNKKYIDRAAKEMVKYLNELQQPNGLFYHAPDAPFFWGRGNGWMAAGMTELLSILPDDNPDRDCILKGYQSMMASLAKYQMPSGMWNQLIDDPDSWAESSCSGMFAYAMITGVKCGWLKGNNYKNCARKAWIALIGYLDENSDVKDVCVGTKKGYTKEYYYKRNRRMGDYHGQAALMWCTLALLK